MILEAVPIIFVGYILLRRRCFVSHAILAPISKSLKKLQVQCNLARGRVFVFSLTFCCYAMFHACRKPLSVVKNVLVSDCHRKQMTPNMTCTPGWAPFADARTSARLLGTLDSTFLFSYAVSMFISGHVAERTDLRLFLSLGMFLSGAATIAFGLAYFLQIHDMGFFLAAQLIGGAFQSTGWPAVVAIMANWYGPQNRGLIMGIWNSHTLVGNILGSVIAAHYVNDLWGFSFVVPGCLLAALSIIVFVALPQNHRNDETLMKLPPPKTLNNSPNYLTLQSHKQNKQLSEQSPTISAVDTTTTAASSSSSPYSSSSSSSSLSSSSEAISFKRALQIPGIIHYSFSLFFAKFVSYSFLFWLPVFLKSTTSLDSRTAALFSTFFDAGGIAGGIVAGMASDHAGAAPTSVFMMLASLPALKKLQSGFHTSVKADFLPIHELTNSSSTPSSFTMSPTRHPSTSLAFVDIVVLLACGFFIQGPKTIITTTVSAALGEHPSLTEKEREEEEEEEEEYDVVEEEVGKEIDGGGKLKTGRNAIPNGAVVVIDVTDSPSVNAENSKGCVNSAKETNKTCADSTALLKSATQIGGAIPNANLLSSSSSSSSSPSSPRKPSTLSDRLPLKALSTVTAIIDGSGSLGAALGPLLTGVVLAPFGWRGVVLMWIVCNFAAALPLVRIVVVERRKNG